VVLEAGRRVVGGEEDGLRGEGPPERLYMSTEDLLRAAEALAPPEIRDVVCSRVVKMNIDSDIQVPGGEPEAAVGAGVRQEREPLGSAGRSPLS
jgi:hypothetical protein